MESINYRPNLQIMAWDGVKANDYFISKYDSQNPDQFYNKPKHDLFFSFQDIEWAKQYVYGECARSAWTKERLLTKLNSIIDNPPQHSKAHSNETYKKAAVDLAVSIKNEIESGKLSF